VSERPVPRGEDGYGYEYGARSGRAAAHSGPRPHPADAGVVGRYVHAYDPFPQPYPTPGLAPIPGMRPARNSAPGFPAFSTTPIYDALYAEFRRAFRTLPGDRGGEDDLLFRPFGTGRGPGPAPAGPRPGGHAGPGPTAAGTGPGALPRAGTGTGRGWSAYALPPGTGGGA
jgi:hypothetical protein